MSEKMTTSEPTTENIAKALRVCYAKSMACSECPLELGDCGHIDEVAADRLERQEQTIAALTARAEQAEAREKAAIADMKLIGGSTFINGGLLYE